MSDGGGSMDPISAVVAMIILSILGYAAYDSLIRSIQQTQGQFQQQNTLPVYEYEVDPNAPILVPQQ